MHMHDSKIAVKFERNCLKQDKVSFTHRNIAKLFSVFALSAWSRDSIQTLVSH